MRKLIHLAPLAMLFLPAPADAHAAPRTAEAWSWASDGLVLVGLVGLAALYAAAVVRTRRRGPKGAVFGGRETAVFAAAVAVLTAALLSPVDTIGGELFAMHMVQHLLLILVAAPLLAASRVTLAPAWLWRGGARRAGAWRASSGRALAGIGHPLSIWALYCGVFVFWHLPGPYRWAVESEVVHAVEHASFLAAAFAFWAVVIDPFGRGRLQHGARLLYVATAAVFSGLPGALMIVASRPFYGVYADSAKRWGLTALEDQQLGGLIMWIPGGLIYLGAISALFLLWLRVAERRALLSDGRRTRLTSAAPALLVALLAACGQESATSPLPRSFGDAELGAQHIAHLGCGSCHVIPGIPGARGTVGPPLTQMGRRAYIAGLLRNTPQNMVHWLRNPQRVVPGNAMPDMGIGEERARDITAYLHGLR